ncbi:MAG: dihydroorotate dehydrogenase electron transfer subunit [Chlorobium sp.]|uniref:dihydroorotate dehydrogenase electron transfer subunit n=1 Tax=Chlorobium sp. TaxID=1095 RepID=UPI0025B7E081|nr:dihydroorotate dehydrogenase electron transfer subunit [Chlorobium sp.]MCF8216785.1 dihydroorotate dehydrogenase electron transfer subunit [Chlorobium sp.]MCF8271653.1 dihydroorotate dehydrogenase electron transfer subunit [Chlorobium sp.]MCF8288025.1 dihydroorotate dehydrogenase electron transfer subunit [Chlorobium sp.]MCF8291588.1 dihydroorotate dehydrogenase electron transfer subunit [Chlorobium sp.]MCF8385724.1 dihydroorotate dehydrogenase electron transfer subunit [Chlorobium sp.]
MTPESATIADVTASITSSRKISRDVSVITFECPEIAAAARPGNFVNIKVNDSTQPLLRRPFSIHDVRGASIDIMVKTVGCGTAILTDSPCSVTMKVLGPLGNSFNCRESSFDTALLVSGGIGNAPMLFLEKNLAEQGISCINFTGGKTSEDLLTENLSNCRAATDDGSAGFRGTVVDLLQRDITPLKASGNLKVFACGPNPMLMAVARFCRIHAIPCEVSLESIMGCGIGICYGCSVEVTTPDGGTGSVLLCREGPVIDAERLVL